MPLIGEIKGGLEAGKNDKYKYIWLMCEDCGVEGRWIRLIEYKKDTYRNRCTPCYKRDNKGKKSPAWRGGKYIDRYGYVRVLASGHPLSYKRGYVPEHRLVAAELFGIEAVRKNVVHHIDGNRQNNSPENLELHSRSDHSRLHNRRPDSPYRLPGESNKVIECKCGCGRTRLKYDKIGRPHLYVRGHSSQTAQRYIQTSIEQSNA